MTFSQGTRSLEMARFRALSLADNGLFLLISSGVNVFGMRDRVVVSAVRAKNCHRTVMLKLSNLFLDNINVG